MQAILEDRNEAIQELVGKGTELNVVYQRKASEAGTTPLIQAIRLDNFEVVLFLLQHGALANVSDNSGNLPLCEAAANSRAEVVHSLIKAGALVNAHNGLNELALILAIQAKQEAIVKLLLDAGADPFLAGAKDENAFSLKSSSSMESILLASRTPEITAAPGRRFSADELRRFLFYAIQSRCTETVKYWVDHGADVNIVTKTGVFPFEEAMNSGNVDVIRILLDAGAFRNQMGSNGQLPLLTALKAENTEVILLLLKKGADPDMRDKYGSSLSSELMTASSELQNKVRPHL